MDFSMLNFVRLFIFLQSLHHILSFHSVRLSAKLSRLFGVIPDDYTVFNDKVEYIDLISSSYSGSSPKSKELPLFLLRSAFFPEVPVFYVESSCIVVLNAHIRFRDRRQSTSLK